MCRIPHWTILGAFALAIAGCNVFEGAHEGASSSNDPRTLIQDASTAIQQGRPEDAIPLLERAIEKSKPASLDKAEAQLKLATALLKAHGVDVLLIERVVTGLTDQFENDVLPTERKASVGTACNFPLDPYNVFEGPIDLNALDGYRTLKQKVEVLGRVRGLLTSALGLPANPRPDFNLDAALAALRAKGASQALVSEAALNTSLAFIGTAYDRIARAGGDDITWLRVTSQFVAEPFLGFCAPSQPVLDRVETAAACSKDDLAFAVRLLRVRASFYAPDAYAGRIAAQAEKANVRISQELNGVCTAS